MYKNYKCLNKMLSETLEIKTDSGSVWWRE
jgi:hypothetical protein